MGNPLEYALRGAVVGHLLGSPPLGAATFRQLKFYEPIPTRINPSPLLESWWIIAQEFGKPDLDLGDLLLNQLQYTTGSAPFARFNRQVGLLPPATGSLRNPYAHDCEAFARAAIYGLISESAAEAGKMALYDSSVDHGSVAAEVGFLVGQFVASVDLGDDVSQRAKEALGLGFPEPIGQDFLDVVTLSLTSHLTPLGFYERLAQARNLVPANDARRAWATLLFVLASEGADFDRAVTLAAGMGQVSQAVATVAGAVVGMANGSVPEMWLEPLSDEFPVGYGMRYAARPDSFSGWVRTIVSKSKRLEPLAADAPAPEVPVEASAPVPESETPVEAPVPEPVPALPSRPPMVAASKPLATHRSEIGSSDLRLAVAAEKWPVAAPIAHDLVLSLENKGELPVDIQPEVIVPPTWRMAHRMTSFRLDADETREFGCVVQAEESGNLELSANGLKLNVPVLKPEGWNLCGPFENNDGLGFDKAFPCETRTSPDEIFSGRSGHTVQWEPFPDLGFIHAVEELGFRSLPGVSYLGARVRFRREGITRVLFAASPGGKVMVDGAVVVRYLDSSPVDLSRADRFIGEFRAQGEHTILVKLIRTLTPVEPVILCFWDADGHLIVPEFLEWT
ncbi:MAG: ADP-ribosylglycohydrolase family protein [Armatimonadetes bacterium]|nr:ADP-ribosylglycohydrolase family protein [Armatimonadota bacterium]